MPSLAVAVAAGDPEELQCLPEPAVPQLSTEAYPAAAAAEADPKTPGLMLAAVAAVK